MRHQPINRMTHMSDQPAALSLAEAEKASFDDMPIARLLAVLEERRAALTSAREAADLAPLAVQRGLMTEDEANEVKAVQATALDSWYRVLVVCKPRLRTELTALGLNPQTVKAVLA
jgi:hypothetical protein